MARVPISSGNQLALAPMSAKRLEAQDTSAGWQAAARGAGNLAAAGMQFAEEQDRLQAQLDEAAAKKLDADYAEYSRQVLHTGDGAFYTLEGFNASNSRETVEKQLEEKRQALIAQAANPRMRAMATDALERRIGADRQGVATYANRQLRVEETRQSARRTATAGDDAVTYFDDPTRFAEEIAVGTSEIRGELAKQGAAPETIQDEVARWRSGVHRRVAEGMLGRMEIDAAIAFVAGNRPNMTESDAAALDRAIAVPLKERKIDGLADYIMGDGAMPPAEGAEPGDPDQLARGLALPMPVEGSIRSGYGMRSHPVDGGRKMHNGVDIPAAAGTPVRAQAAGRVTFADVKGDNGNLVIVDYGNGVEARYAHLQGFDVKAGDVVKPGQSLGGVGSTGKSTGPHVHYSLLVNGAHVDPSKFAGVTGRPSGGSRTPVQQSGLTREAAMARIDELNLPLEEERALRQEVNTRFAQDEAIERDRQETARDAALTLLNQADALGKPLTRESAIPSSVWDAMDPGDAMSIRATLRSNAEPEPVETNMGTFLALSDIYATDPKRFARLNPADYLGQLSKSDFAQVFGTWRRDVLETQTKGVSENQVTHERIRSLLSPALAAAGLSTTGIPTKDTAARDEMNRRIYRAQKAVQDEIELYQRAHPGERVPDTFIREVVDRQLTPTRARSDVGSDGWFTDTAPTYVPWFERSRLGTSEVAVKIPPATRARLERMGREVLGRKPTETEISEAYFKELRR